jgi:hypothetical protein
MGRSPGFGSTPSNSRPLQTRFRSGSSPEGINLAARRNSPVHSSIGTPSPFSELGLLVGTRFQVLFHSPPGVLFTFPSRYSPLSVAKEYLALGGGPPSFPRGSSCPVVLGSQVGSLQPFAYRALTSYGRPFQTASARPSGPRGARQRPILGPSTPVPQRLPPSA